MTVFEKVNVGIKKLISFLYRCIILMYSLTILLTFSNYFEWYIYISALAVYFFIFFKLFYKEGTYAFLRTLNDFIFIFIIIYGKGVENIHTFTLVTLPLINSLNHSSKAPTKLLSLLKVYILAFVTLFVLNDFLIRFEWFIILLTLASINLFLHVRTVILDLRAALNESVEEFYEANLGIGKSHKILELIVTKHQKSDLAKNAFFEIDRITCFKFAKDSLRIVNSSKFIKSFTAKDEMKIFDQLLSTGIAKNCWIKIDGEIVDTNYFVLIKSNSSDNFVFVVDLKGSSKTIFSDLYLKKILIPLFYKITKVLNVEYHLKKEQKKYVKQIKEKMDILDSAGKAIHYLNNRLSPILNYFELLKIYNDPSTEPQKRVKLFKILQREQINALKNIKPIISKTHEIADKSKNPYIVTNTETVKFGKLFTLIRELWDDNEFASRGEVKMHWDDVLLDKKVSLNIDAFTFAIDEILDNINEHSKSEERCFLKFALDDDLVPTIIFSNKIKDSSKEKEEVLRLIQDFNRDNLSEILKRSRSGMRMIKQYLLQLDIDHKLTMENNILFLKLIIKPLN